MRRRACSGTSSCRATCCSHKRTQAAGCPSPLKPKSLNFSFLSFGLSSLDRAAQGLQRDIELQGHVLLAHTHAGGWLPLPLLVAARGAHAWFRECRPAAAEDPLVAAEALRTCLASAPAQGALLDARRALWQARTPLLYLLTHGMLAACCYV